MSSSPPGFSWQIDFKEEVKQEKEEVGVLQVECENQSDTITLTLFHTRSVFHVEKMM